MGLLLIVFVFFNLSNGFSQNIMQNDPLQGIWFSESGGDRFVLIFFNGLYFQLGEHNSFSIVGFSFYTISGGSVIISKNENEFVMNIIIIDDYRIVLTSKDATYLLEKQSGIDIKQEIEGYLNITYW
jgi:hypothetical protein